MIQNITYINSLQVDLYFQDADGVDIGEKASNNAGVNIPATSPLPLISFLIQETPSVSFSSINPGLSSPPDGLNSVPSMETQILSSIKGFIGQDWTSAVTDVLSTISSSASDFTSPFKVSNVKITRYSESTTDITPTS